MGRRSVAFTDWTIGIDSFFYAPFFAQPAEKNSEWLLIEMERRQLGLKKEKKKWASSKGLALLFIFLLSISMERITATTFLLPITFRLSNEDHGEIKRAGGISGLALPSPIVYTRSASFQMSEKRKTIMKAWKKGDRASGIVKSTRNDVSWSPQLFSSFFSSSYSLSFASPPQKSPEKIRIQILRRQSQTS